MIRFSSVLLVIAMIGFSASFAAAGGQKESSGASAHSLAGTTVHFLTERDVHELALSATMAAIAKKWGVTFAPRYIPTSDLPKQIVLDYVAGATTWDLYYTGGIQNMFEEYHRGIVTPISDLMQKYGDTKTLDFSGFTRDAQSAVTYDGKILGLVVATSTQGLAYRKDLFDNPVEKAAFKAKYGYDLTVPQTYQQFRDVALFFTRKKGQMLAGKPLQNDFYGTAFANQKGAFLFHSYENMLAAFGVQLYDPATGKVGFDSPANIAAAEYYKSLLPAEPPDQINMTAGEAADLFAHGDMAMIIEYVDRITHADQPNTPVYGKVGITFPPTVPNNPLNRNHAFRNGPAVVCVYSLSKNKEAAYKLLTAAITSENQIAMAKNYNGYIPSRVSALQAVTPLDKPLYNYVLSISKDKIDAMTDAAIIQYPAIIRAGQISDAVSNSITDILEGTPVKTALAQGQQKIVTALQGLKP